MSPVCDATVPTGLNGSLNYIFSGLVGPKHIDICYFSKISVASYFWNLKNSSNRKKGKISKQLKSFVDDEAEKKMIAPSSVLDLDQFSFIRSTFFILSSKIFSVLLPFMSFLLCLMFTVFLLSTALLPTFCDHLSVQLSEDILQMALTRISTFCWLPLIGDTLVRAIPPDDRHFTGSLCCLWHMDIHTTLQDGKK